MPVTDTAIDKYSVSTISAGNPNGFFATMSLFAAGGTCLAFLRFYEAGATMAPNEFRADLGYPLLSFPASSLAPTVDVLRNEKPVYFTWFDYRPARCFGAVGTSREPVGEGEA